MLIDVAVAVVHEYRDRTGVHVVRVEAVDGEVIGDCGGVVEVGGEDLCRTGGGL
jgi:hypothetical protein